MLLIKSSQVEMVVNIGESKDWKAPGREFDVPGTIVGLRSRHLGRVMLSQGVIVDDTIVTKYEQEILY